MKKFLVVFIALLMVVTLACSQKTEGNITKEIEYIDTGVNPDQWVRIPAGKFYKGLHRHETMIDKDYEIMVTDVTNQQYANYLNQALAADSIKIVDHKVIGYYPINEPFYGHKHEFKITAGDKLYYPLDEPGVRIKFDGQKFTVVKGFENHPVTFVTWFGAFAYARFYGWRLPSENEWEKAARGTDTSSYPWGEEIYPNIANYHSSRNLFQKLFGKDITTTPVGFYNGKTYNGYQTRDNRSPFGLYDMAGNVWQWCGDDYPYVHYRYMRGGSHTNYEYNLRVWARNSAGPDYYSMYVGFRCARDVQPAAEEQPKSEQ